MIEKHSHGNDRELGHSTLEQEQYTSKRQDYVCLGTLPG